MRLRARSITVVLLAALGAAGFQSEGARTTRERPAEPGLAEAAPPTQPASPLPQASSTTSETPDRFQGYVPVKRPPQEMTTCMAAADVLVSPRSSGSNTPLKIYSYMHSGRPIVATRIESHTQVMDDLSALLVEPDPGAFAAGIDAVLRDPALAARLGAASRERGERHFSIRAFVEGTARAYVKLGAPYPDPHTLEAAVRRLEPAAVPGGGNDLDADVA